MMIMNSHGESRGPNVCFETEKKPEFIDHLQESK